MKKLLAMTVLLFVFAGTQLWADVVEFKNGDKLTGTFVKMTDGKVVFKTEVNGEVTLELDVIKRITTETEATVVFADGTTIKTKLLADEEGKFKSEDSKVVSAQTFTLADVTAINPPPKAKATWKGGITAGLTSSHGNTYSENGSISVTATLRREKDRTNMFANYMIGRSEDADGEKVTTDENFTLGGKYDYFFSEKCFAFINGRYKKDHIADLDRRIVVGAGAGYQWIESDTMNFSTDIGLAEVSEKYVTPEKTDTTDSLSAQVGYHFDAALNKKITFEHNMIYYPSVNRSVSDYYLTTDAVIRISLTDAMFTSFSAVLDYDSTPADGVSSTDTKYIIGIGWTF